MRVVAVGGRFGGGDGAVDLAAVHGDFVPEDSEQLAEGRVQIEAVTAPAGQDSGDGLGRVDALRASEQDVEVLEGDELDVCAVKPAQGVERRSAE